MILEEEVLKLIQQEVIADFENWDNLTEEYQSQVKRTVLKIIDLVMETVPEEGN